MPQYEIPLEPKSQTFSVQLGAFSYHLTFYWNQISTCWMLDIADANEVVLGQGLPVITGLDLLYQYSYLGIPGSLVVLTDYAPAAVPTIDNLGLAGRVFFVTG